MSLSRDPPLKPHHQGQRSSCSPGRGKSKEMGSSQNPQRWLLSQCRGVKAKKWEITRASWVIWVCSNAGYVKNSFRKQGWELNLAKERGFYFWTIGTHFKLLNRILHNHKWGLGTFIWQVDLIWGCGMIYRESRGQVRSYSSQPGVKWVLFQVFWWWATLNGLI